MANIIDAEATVTVETALIEFTRKELEVLNNVLYRVQLGTDGYGAAASEILGAVEDLIGEVEHSDHFVEMRPDGYGSLYWS